jgi:hypothetical protein
MGTIHLPFTSIYLFFFWGNRKTVIYADGLGLKKDNLPMGEWCKPRTGKIYSLIIFSTIMHILFG